MHNTHNTTRHDNDDTTTSKQPHDTTTTTTAQHATTTTFQPPWRRCRMIGSAKCECTIHNGTTQSWHPGPKHSGDINMLHTPIHNHYNCTTTSLAQVGLHQVRNPHTGTKHVRCVKPNMPNNCQTLPQVPSLELRLLETTCLLQFGC